MKLFNQKQAASKPQAPLQRLGVALHRPAGQQDPFQWLSVWRRIGFPNTHDVAANRRQVTWALTRALRPAQPNSDSADLQLSCSGRLPRSRTQFQGEVAQRFLRARCGKELARYFAALFIGQATILRGANHEAMIEFSATDQHFVDVRASITNASPLNWLVIRRRADRLAGLQPPLRFARTVFDDFGVVRRFAFGAPFPHPVVLRRQAQHFDCRSPRPILSLLRLAGHRTAKTECRWKPCKPEAPGPTGPNPGIGRLPDQLISLLSSSRR